MDSQLPASVLALPVQRISLHALTRATRNRLSPAIQRGRIRTIGELVAQLEPPQLRLLRPALTALTAVQPPPPVLPPGIDDLLDMFVYDLLRTADLPSAGSSQGWSLVRSVLYPITGRADPVTASVLKALEIRSERRSAALVTEAERAPIRALPPPPQLVPLWSDLLDTRVKLRKDVVPEGEHEILVKARVEEDPPRIEMTSADGYQRVRLSLDEARSRVERMECRDPRWALAAVDRLLDWIADPDSEVRSTLVHHLRRPVWDRDLARLDSLLGGLTAVAPVVGWRVVEPRGGSLSFRAVKCTPKKKGGWSTRNADWSEVAGATDPMDARVVGLLRRWRTAPPEVVAIVAESLIGHPRVFAPGSSGAPIRVRRAELAVAFVREGVSVRPRLEVDGVAVPLEELNEQIDDGGADTWLRLVPGELQVVTVRQEVAAVLVGWLGRGSPVAADGVGALLERIPSLSPLVSVRLDEGLRGEAVEGDPRPVLRVRWDGGTLAVEARVRPLPELPPVAPGEGLDELVTMRGGSPCFVRRERDLEPGRVLEAMAPLGLEGAERDGWRWLVTEPKRAIDVLLAIGEAGGAFRTEWDGPAATVQRITPAGLKVKVSGRDWFAVSGSVETDEGPVDLTDLLAAIREGQSFLQVRPNVFVRIAEQLRSALRPIAAAEDTGRLTPLQAPILAALTEAGATVDGSEAFTASVERIRAAESVVAEVPAGLGGVLREYQVEGFRWLARLATWAPGAVLADDMGLGKTVQAITLLRHRAASIPGKGPALVVCPLSVLSGWETELARFGPELEVSLYRGSGRARQLEAFGPRSVLLTSWDLLARDAGLAEVAWDTVVLDEAQAIKNAHTARSKAARALKSAFVVALTGTPVENRSEELWSLFRSVAPGLLGTEKRFAERFAGPIDRGEPGAREVLARLVRPFVLRRTKREVAPELPSRTEVVVRIPLSAEERALYDAARLEAVVRTSEASGAGQRFEILRWLTRLRQLACNPKLVDPGSPIASSKLEQIRRRIADLRASGHQTLVFSQFVSHLELVRDALVADGAAVRWLTGDVEEAQRRREVAAFQAGEGDVFLISLGAGGTGLNLTAATYVFHLDPWWNPAKEDQASDRAHRIGQTRPVTVYRLVAEGTIEEQILALHEEKRDLADALLAGADGAARIGTDELLALLSDEALPVPAILAHEAAMVVGPVESPTPPSVEEPRDHGFAEEVLARFRASLAEEHASGRIKGKNTVRSYERVLENLLRWAGPPADREALVDATQRYLAALARGEIPHASDKVYARPAFTRLLAAV